MLRNLCCRCECQFGFTGYLCERPPAQLTWSEWGPWSPCSVTCGIGTRTRTRTCPRPGECAGKPEQTGMCHGRVLSCDNVRNATADDDTGAKITSKSLEERLREVSCLSQHCKQLSELIIYSTYAECKQFGFRIKS